MSFGIVWPARAQSFWQHPSSSSRGKKNLFKLNWHKLRQDVLIIVVNMILRKIDWVLVSVFSEIKSLRHKVGWMDVV